MFPGQYAKPVLQAKTSEHCAVRRSCLAIQIEFSGPPACRAIFKFHRWSKESVTTRRLSDDPFRANLQISRFFHLMRIGDEIGSFPSPGRSQTNKNSRDRLREPAASE